MHLYYESVPVFCQEPIFNMQNRHKDKKDQYYPESRVLKDESPPQSSLQTSTNQRPVMFYRTLRAFSLLVSLAIVERHKKE